MSLRVLSYVAIGYVYLQVVLEWYPWSRPLSRRLGSLVLDPLGSMAAAVLDAVPNLIFIALLVLVTRYLLKLVRLFFAGIAGGTITLANFDREWAWPTYRIVRFVAVAFAVVVAYPYIPGSQLARLSGRVDLHRRDLLPGLLLVHFQPDRGIQHDLPAGVPGRAIGSRWATSREMSRKAG